MAFNFDADTARNFVGDGTYYGWDSFWTPCLEKAPVRAMYGIAYAFVLFRFGLRIGKRQFGLDDVVTMLAFVVSIPIFAIFNIIPSNNLLPAGSNPEHIGRSTAWTTIVGHDLVIWASRLAIALVVSKVIPVNNAKNLRMSMFACFAFVALWLSVAISQVFVCGKPGGRTMSDSVKWYPGCIVPTKAPAAFSLFADLMSTLWLVFWPICALKTVRLGDTPQRLATGFALLAVIVSPLSVFAVSIARFAAATRGMPPSVRGSQYFWHIQVPLALMICNFLPLIMSFIGSIPNHVASTPAVNIRTPVDFPGDFSKEKQIETVSDEGNYGTNIDTPRLTSRV